MSVCFTVFVSLRVYKLLLALLLPHLALAQNPGVVTDSVRCQKTGGQTYALYLPESYTSSTPVGVVLIFDPGARGKLPVDLYKKLADQYGVILACSNNSRNGPFEQSLFAGNAVLDDLLSRFNIDRSFILTSGFSGGGRAAVQMAVSKTNIAGVITCGASFPSPNAITKTRPAPFAEVIGQLDMNFQESLTASIYLKSIENPSSLTFFYGGHQWPPAEAYEEALAWHSLRHKKLNTSEAFSAKMKKVKMRLDSGYLYEGNRMLSQMRSDFNEIKQAQTIDSLLTAIRKDKRLKSETRDVGSTNTRELAMQDQFRVRYGQHMAYGAPDSAYHAEYWKGFRRECEKMLSAGGYKKLGGLRLIDFGWRLCAEQHYIFLEYGQYRQASMAARIWALMLPDRPGPCIQAAKAFALQKRKSETMEYLRLAVARGLIDKDGIRKDQAFSEFANDEQFQTILK